MSTAGGWNEKGIPLESVTVPAAVTPGPHVGHMVFEDKPLFEASASGGSGWEGFKNPAKSEDLPVTPLVFAARGEREADHKICHWSRLTIARCDV